LPCVQGPHDERDRLAPEWQPILQQLQQLAPQLAQLESLARRGSNATAAAAVAAAAVRDVLRPATEWDAATGQLLVGAVVHFPGVAGPAQHAAAAATPAGHAQRAQRVMLERKRRDAGGAAAADWAPVLQQKFGAYVRRGSADTAVVLAPAGKLQDVLQWLAERPATQWVAPAPKLKWHNVRGSTISQVHADWVALLSCLPAGLQRSSGTHQLSPG
jgi:hypothetical protein